MHVGWVKFLCFKYPSLWVFVGTHPAWLMALGPSQVPFSTTKTPHSQPLHWVVILSFIYFLPYSLCPCTPCTLPVSLNAFLSVPFSSILYLDTWLNPLKSAFTSLNLGNFFPLYLRPWARCSTGCFQTILDWSFSEYKSNRIIICLPYSL